MIERCVARAREEYDKDRAGFADDSTRIDAAILNIQRAYYAAEDAAAILVRRSGEAFPPRNGDVFARLVDLGQIDAGTAGSMAAVDGFVTDAHRAPWPFDHARTIAVIEERLGDLLAFARLALRLGNDYAPTP